MAMGENFDKGWIYYLDVACTNQTKDKKNGKCHFEEGTQEERKKRNKTCSVLKEKYPGLSNGVYHISPQETGTMSFPVYCNMTSKNGVGVTVIRHNSESRTKVDGYEAPGSYKRDIVYGATTEQIAAIMNETGKCEQFIKYECHHSGKYDFWWVSRQGNKMNYWGGAAVNSGKCACGMTNTCAGGGSCNCFMNDDVLREDSGFLVDKNTLPVKQLRFGDTGYTEEYGYHTLGKLECWG